MSSRVRAGRSRPHRRVERALPTRAGPAVQMAEHERHHRGVAAGSTCPDDASADAFAVRGGVDGRRRVWTAVVRLGGPGARVRRAARHRRLRFASAAAWSADTPGRSRPIAGRQWSSPVRFSSDGSLDGRNDQAAFRMLPRGSGTEALAKHAGDLVRLAIEEDERPTMSGSDPKRLVQAAKLRRMTRSAPARASSPFNRRPQMRRRPQHRENPRRDQPASQRIRAVRSQHRGPRCRAVSGNVLERHGLGTERLQLDVTGECTTRLERSVPGVPGRHTPLGSHAHQGVGVGIWQPPDCRRY